MLCDLSNFQLGFDFGALAIALYGPGFRFEDHLKRRPTFCNITGVWEKKMHYWLETPECSICLGYCDE